MFVVKIRLGGLWGGHAEQKTKAYFRGYVRFGSQTHSFCIDSADSPNMFSGKLLKDVDIYFKLQCPNEISEKGFLIGNQYIPFLIPNLKILQMKVKSRQSVNYVQMFILMRKRLNL